MISQMKIRQQKMECLQGVIGEVNAGNRIGAGFGKAAHLLQKTYFRRWVAQIRGMRKAQHDKLKANIDRVARANLGAKSLLQKLGERVIGEIPAQLISVGGSIVHLRGDGNVSGF